MKTLKTLAATVAATSAALALGVGPAGAAFTSTYVWNDPSGDAPASADITSFSDVDGTTLRTRVVDLGDAGTLDVYFNGGAGLIRVNKTAGQTRTVRTYFREYDDPYAPTFGPWQESTSCKPGATWDAGGNTVTLTLSGSCIDEYLDSGGAVSAWMKTTASDKVDLRRAPDSATTTGSETYPDPRGDAPARADITSVRNTFTTDKQWLATSVVDLHGSGRVRAFYSEYREFSARVVVTKDTGEAPKATLVYRDEPYDAPWSAWYHVPCAIQVNWNASTNLVNIGVPLSCKKGMHSTFFRMDTTMDGASDKVMRNW